MIVAQHPFQTLLFRNAAEVLRWIAQRNQRPVERTYLGKPEKHGAYWLGQETLMRLSDEDYARVYAVLVRYQAYVHHMTEVDPQWEDGQATHWADNSVDVEQHSRTYPGLTRRVQRTAPHGDAC